MQLSYIYWEAKEGGYIGYLNQYPDYWTQGDSIKELEKMLASLYGDIVQFDDIQPVDYTTWSREYFAACDPDQFLKYAVEFDKNNPV